MDVGDVTVEPPGHTRREWSRSLLAALSGLAAESWAPALVEQLVRLSVAVLEVEHAALVVDGDDAPPDRVLFSTTDPGALAELQALLGPHLVPAASGGPDFRASPVVLQGPASDGLVRPVLQVSMTLTTGGSGRLFVVGQPGRPAFSAADEELVAEFARFAALSVENALHSQQSRQQVHWLRGLTLITQSLLQADVDELAVWQEIADRVHQLARARTVTISTVSEDDPDLLEVRVAGGGAGDQALGPLSVQESALAARSMATRSWQIAAAGDSPPPGEGSGPAGATLAVPLLDRQGVRGALLVSRHARQGPFQRTEVAMVHDFANQAVLAVELAETRAAERSLLARTAEEEVGGTFQDRTIQRLFAASLAAEAAIAHQPEPWLTRLYAEITAVIEDARTSLETEYGRTS